MSGLGFADPGLADPGFADPGFADRVASIARRDRKRAEAALTIAAHERQKARRSDQRVRELERELAALRSSAAYRVTYPLRRLASAIPAGLYASLRGGAAGPVGEGNAPAGMHIPETGGSAADPRPAVLLIDDWFPEPDRDSGSIDIVNLACVFRDLGFRVLFGADRDHDVPSQRRDALAALCIHPLGPGNGVSVTDFLERRGSDLAVVVLNRLYCGGNHYEAVRSHAPSARVIFNTVDLHWVRMEREAGILGDATLVAAAGRARTRELALAQAADATIVVSPAERDMLSAAAPDATIVELPLARAVRPPVAPFEARSGIGFIGGFRHSPNLDALRWFASEIWPLVRAELPDCRFSVVGADLPAGLLDGVPGRVEILGHLPDIEPWFETLRVTVAPLRFGAGVKGKVVSSLASGVPCVATTLALEGMGITRETNVAVIADDPVMFASSLVALHQDRERWTRMSPAGTFYVRDHYSIATWRERLADLLWLLGALAEPTVAPEG